MKKIYNLMNVFLLLLYYSVFASTASAATLFQVGDLTLTGITAIEFSPTITRGYSSVDRVVDNFGNDVGFTQEINAVFGGFQRTGTSSGFGDGVNFSSDGGFVRFYANDAGTFQLSGDVAADIRLIESGTLLLGGEGHLDPFGNTATGVVSADNYTSSGSIDFNSGSSFEQFDNNLASLSGADGLFTINGSRTFDLGGVNYLGISNVSTKELAAVPLPSSAWLFGSVLAGGLGFTRRPK